MAGIYDVPALQASFPSYREWFLADAFGEESIEIPFAGRVLAADHRDERVAAFDRPDRVRSDEAGQARGRLE